MTLHDLGMCAVKMREALGEMELRGARNASILLYCVKQCDEIVKAVNEAAAEAAGDDASDASGECVAEEAGG